MRNQSQQIIGLFISYGGKKKSFKENDFFFERKFYVHPNYRNYSASKNGKIINIKKKALRNFQMSNSSYQMFSVWDFKDKKTVTPLAHRSIYECIKGKRSDDKEVQHINGC